MARNAFQSWLLRTRIRCDILFDPEKLEPDAAYEEPEPSVNMRFKKLPESQQAALRAYFSTPRIFPIIPTLRIYKLTNRDQDGKPQYGARWEYDQIDRRLEAKRLALSGFDLSRLGDTYYSYTQLRELRRACEKGIDTEPLLDNRYNRFQLMVLTKAISDGYDVSDYAHPNCSAAEMANCFAAQVEEHYVSKVEYRANKEVYDRLCEVAVEEHGLTPVEPGIERRLQDAQQRAKLEILHKEGNVVKVNFGDSNEYAR